MNREQGIRHAQAVSEMYDSLLSSINEAGGSGSGFKANKLTKMTVMELIATLAPNGIRFVFEPPEELV